MKRTLSVIALTVASMGIIVPPAQADTPGCVSRTEFGKVRKGMSKMRVHQIFDTRGRRTMFSASSGMADEFRDYRTCMGSRGSFVSINFDDYSHGSDRRGGPMEVYGKSIFIF